MRPRTNSTTPAWWTTPYTPGPHCQLEGPINAHSHVTEVNLDIKGMSCPCSFVTHDIFGVPCLCKGTEQCIAQKAMHVHAGIAIFVCSGAPKAVNQTCSGPRAALQLLKVQALHHHNIPVE